MKNKVTGFPDKTAVSEFKTILGGPKRFCTELLEENHTFYLEEKKTLVSGEIGCQGRLPVLFFKDMELKEGVISTSANGYDYTGTPIYFDINGSLDSGQLGFDISMYTNAGRTNHVRTDHCSGGWDGESFYDGSCNLIQNSNAGCNPIWTQLQKQGDNIELQELFYPIEKGDNLEELIQQ